MFYNTINAEGETLNLFHHQAETQTEAILRLFKQKMSLSPGQVFNHFDGRYPITSIRRAITDLTTLGHLEKTELQIKGLYNKPEYVWKKSELE